MANPSESANNLPFGKTGYIYPKNLWFHSCAALKQGWENIWKGAYPTGKVLRVHSQRSRADPDFILSRECPPLLNTRVAYSYLVSSTNHMDHSTELTCYLFQSAALGFKCFGAEAVHRLSSCSFWYIMPWLFSIVSANTFFGMDIKKRKRSCSSWVLRLKSQEQNGATQIIPQNEQCPCGNDGVRDNDGHKEAK